MLLSVERFEENTAIYEIDPYGMALGRVTISTTPDRLGDHEFERVILDEAMALDPQVLEEVEALRKR